MDDDLSEFLKKSNTIAVVGASRNRKKFGYRVYATLKRNGYNVYPVNPQAERIDDDRCYPSLAALPKKPDVVITVVRPKITEGVVKEMKKLNLNKVWMQPGSESASATLFAPIKKSL